ncbi:MAG: LysM peptidoglycan-binding domain-containing protein, partial [Chloroflexi bacterium]|nr:LysM peptidoglycan-binding domain-containing protein [Chloroflexota bacterium]
GSWARSCVYETGPEPVDDDSDPAGVLAASMVRTDLIGGGPAPATPGTDGAADEGTPPMPPRARGRRVPMDAGAPASLGPQTRPGTPPSGPREWEGARRFEAYAARTGSRRPGRPVVIAIGTALVAVALLVVFLLPSLFRGGTGAPSNAPESAAVGDVTRTPRPTPAGSLPPEATPLGPEPTPGSYRIKRGDTLSAIGRKFNVTVEQLICANRIRNANSLSTGVTIVIPIETFKCPRPTKKPAKTPKG